MTQDDSARYSISDELVDNFNRPTVINHRSNKVIPVSPYYGIVSKNKASWQVIGLIHANYVGINKLTSCTAEGITAQSMGWSIGSIAKAIRELVDNKWLDATNFTHQQAKTLICSKVPQKIQTKLPVDTCSWCKGTSLILHEHHYPVSKADGGKDIVLICPNCHYEFHLLTKVTFYSSSEKLVSFFNLSVDSADAMLAEAQSCQQ